MAHIEDRWYKTVTVDDRPVQVPKPSCGKGLRYRVRYKGPDGRECSESFPDKRKREAKAFLARVQADIDRGAYVDPAAGRMTLQSYATAWLDGTTTSQTHAIVKNDNYVYTSSRYLARLVTVATAAPIPRQSQPPPPSPLARSISGHGKLPPVSISGGSVTVG